MRIFYKNQYKIVTMVVLTLLLQILGPIVEGHIYADVMQGQRFEITETIMEEGDATIDWTLTLNSGDTARTYQLEVEFTLDEIESGDLLTDNEDETKIGSYTISKEGELLVTIEDELYEALGQRAENSEATGPAIEGPTPITYTGSIKVSGVIDKLTDNEKDPVSFNDIVLEHVDEDGKPVSGDFQVDSHVKINFSYEIEDLIQVDTNKIYKFTIPKEIPIIADFGLDLTDKKNDRVLGKIVITKDPTGATGGFMTVQFLDEINNENHDEEREGWITITSQFGNIEISDGGDKEIQFEVNGESKSITVTFEKIQEKQTVTLKKTGNYNTNNNEITWKIEVIPKTESTGRMIENVRIEDIIEEGQTYIKGSAALNGTTIDLDPVTDGVLEYTFIEPITDGEVYTITFKTKPNLSKFVNQGDILTFENTVTGTYGEDNEPIEESKYTVTTEVNFIKKWGVEVPGKGLINWTIEINNNNLELPAGVTIEDTIGEWLMFNNDLKIDGESFAKYGTLTRRIRGFTFKFTNPIDKKYTLTYSTTVIDPSAYLSNTPKEYYNNAKITWEQKPGGPTSTGNIGVRVSTSVIHKTAKGYNAATHEITWEILVNGNRITIINPIVTDTLPSTLEYVSHSVSGSKRWQFNNRNGKLRFWYLGSIKEPYTITLVTKIKDEYKGYFGDNGTQKISNTAKLIGIGVKDSESIATQEVTSKVIEKSGVGYDYITRKASWKIVVNQNKMPITNAVVTDEIQGEFHEFVKDSLKVNGDTFTNYTVDGSTIRINLGDIEEETTITFETQIPEDKVNEFFEANGDETLKNEATITGDEIKDGGVEVTATQDVNNTVVSKKGIYKDGSDFIDWEVVINSNRLKLNNVTLEDTLQEGLILDSMTVRVNELTIKSDGTYEEGLGKSIVTTYNPLTNEVTFDIGNISNAYILRFRTDVEDAHSNTAFKNTIKLKGSNGEQEGNSNSIGVKFQTGDAGGSGTSTRGTLTVIKLEEKAPLAGAIFELLKEDRRTVIGTSSTTSEDGTVIFNDLRMGKYYIRENQAPKGYVQDEELKEVELKKGVDTKYITYEFENTKIKGNIELYKKDKEENLLSGAEFTLYHKTDKTFEHAIDRAISDESGLVKFEHIPYGEYVIKETIAPVGYEPSDKVLTAEIKENNKTILLEDMINERIIGDLEVIKKGDTGETLEGAEFELRNNNKVYTGTTDEKGRIVFKDIDHGTYTLKETKAPRGHILNAETHEVKIVEYEQDIIRKVLVNHKIKGLLEILKVDSRTKRPLRNARFTLYDGNMNQMAEITTGTDGKVVFENLVYGKYFYEETKAPGGYYIDKTVYELNIPESEDEILENGFVIEKVVDNRRRPEDPVEPVEPQKPTDPEVPTEPIEVPDPNDPNSPGDFILIDEDEIPLGTYEEQENPDGTYVYIDEDDIPLGVPEVSKIDEPLVPQTGDNIPVVLLLILFITSLLSAIYLIIFKRKRFNP